VKSGSTDRNGENPSMIHGSNHPDNMISPVAAIVLRVRRPADLGIEAVGLVEGVPGNEFREGDVVAIALGGFDAQAGETGGYGIGT
jgi:hypothetical protein